MARSLVNENQKGFSSSFFTPYGITKRLVVMGSSSITENFDFFFVFIGVLLRKIMHSHFMLKVWRSPPFIIQLTKYSHFQIPTKITNTKQPAQLFNMKIVKKEKIDVKKFMEEIKANRTNRSFTSLEYRNSGSPNPMVEHRTGTYENFSKGSVPPPMHHSPSFNGDSYRFYSNYSQMSQNSQQYMPSQLNSVYNQPQPYLPYGQPYGSTANIPCSVQGTIGVPYNMQGYPTNMAHLAFTPRDQYSNQKSGPLYKPRDVGDDNCEGLNWKKNNPAAKIEEALLSSVNQQDSQNVESDLKEQKFKVQTPRDAQAEVVKKKQKKKQNKQREKSANKQSLQIKKQLEEVISKQRTEMLEEKKQAKVIQRILEDFNARIQQYIESAKLQTATEQIKMQAARIAEIQIQNVDCYVQAEKRTWQQLQSQVLEKIGV